MSIFGNIMGKIFHHAEAAEAPKSAGTPPATPSPAPGSAPTPGAPPASPAPTTTASASPSAPSKSVDVESVLSGLAAKNSQTLDWKHSIVDMMKLLDLDSSLAARKTLAGELHYTGSTDDSAAMNMWLHKAVMQKLAENGGVVPDSLKG